MEITCNRCHQTVEADNCYCPVCGLPQLLYTAETSTGPGQPARWNEAVRDAGSIEWKPALKCALILSLPAGLLCALAFLARASFSSLLLMAITGAWTVALYLRSQRPAWITIGAGARIGMVSGVLGSWTWAAASALGLYAMRYWFHYGKSIDGFWDSFVSQQLTQQWSSMGVDAQTIAVTKAWMLSPEGRAGWTLFIICSQVAVLLGFALAGGALGARFLARSRRPEV